MERLERINCEDKINKPLYGAIAWSMLSIGTIVMVLTASGEEGDVYQDNRTQEPVNEKRIEPPVHFKALFEEDPILAYIQSPTLTAASSAVEVATQSVNQSVIIRGKATYYGVNDGYGLHNRLGCPPYDAFNPDDPTTAARPYSSPFTCGDKVKVCDSDSCVEVVIKDACPGCDDYGIVIDLSYGTMKELTGRTGSIEVTLEKIQ